MDIGGSMLFENNRFYIGRGHFSFTNDDFKNTYNDIIKKSDSLNDGVIFVDLLNRKGVWRYLSTNTNKLEKVIYYL